MPHKVKVRAPLGRYILANRDPELGRRLTLLRMTPFPPGSRSASADADWHSLAGRFAPDRTFIYGSADHALVYTSDLADNTLYVQFAIVGGRIVGLDD